MNSSLAAIINEAHMISAKPSALAEGNNVITENKIARHK